MYDTTRKKGGEISMADEDFDLDDKDEGDDNTDQDSSPDEKTDDDSDSAQAASRPSDEDSEVIKEWGTLKGSHQDRIRQLVREKNEALKKMETKGTDQSVPPAPNQDAISTDAQRAAQTLRDKFKFVDEDVLDRKLQQLSDSMILNQTHDRLEGKFTGTDGRPRYDREVIEDHIRKTGILNPEAAYENLYKDELTDYHVKELMKNKAPYSEGPAKPARKGAPSGLSREDIAKMTPAEYERNREKILKLAQAGDL